MFSRHVVRVLFLVSLAGPASAQVNLFSDDEARERLTALETKLAELEAQLQNLNRQNAALTAEKQNLLQSLRDLSGVVEETNVTAARQASRIEEVDSKLSGEIDATAQQFTATIDQLTQDLTETPAIHYARAVTALEQGNLLLAQKTWQDLLLRYPESEFEVASRYWLARLAFDRQEYAVAHDALLAVLTRYPQHARVPDVLSLLAETALAQGDYAQQTYWHNRILTRHPASAAADALRLDSFRTTQ